MDSGFWLTMLFFGGLLVFAFGFILLVTRYKRCASDEILVVYGRVSGGKSITLYPWWCNFSLAFDSGLQEVESYSNDNQHSID